VARVGVRHSHIMTVVRHAGIRHAHAGHASVVHGRMLAGISSHARHVLCRGGGRCQYQAKQESACSHKSKVGASERFLLLKLRLNRVSCI
jgi:hypothetical protein